MLYSLFRIYVTSETVGSPDRMYQLLKEARSLHPVSGNADGEYLTMRSTGGGYTGLIYIGAGFASAVDSQLFQKAIAADPRSTFKGYIIGGLSWFTIPFVLASTYGLAAAATEHLPSFPIYPNRLNTYEVSSGMAMPYAAYAVSGRGGVIAILLMLFMAVTSAMSSETVATSALLSYNFYQAYINPRASAKQLLIFSHGITISFAIVAAGVACGLNHAGFNVSFLVTAIGIFVDSAIVPMACTILWKRQSRLAVIGAPLVTSGAAILAWILVAYTEIGYISIDSLSENKPLVAGNILAVTGPFVLTPLFTLYHPQDFDWRIFVEQIKPSEEEVVTNDGEIVVTNGENPDAPPEVLEEEHRTEIESLKVLLGSRNRAIAVSVFLTLALTILFPIPMYGTGYVFSKPFFRGWVVVLFIYAFLAAGTITLLPIIDARGYVTKLLRGRRSHMDREVYTTEHAVYDGGKTAPVLTPGVVVQPDKGAETHTSKEEKR